jgi:DNA-binding XRE family transcriptional regulator
MNISAPAVPATRIVRTYPGRPDQIRCIRHDLRDLLTDCPAVDSVLLCASELATNAVLHSDSARPGGQLTVTATLTPGQTVRVAVTDQGGRWDWRGRIPHYHGLYVVHATAANWGIKGDYRSRTTWALLNWTPCRSRYAPPVQPPSGTTPAALITQATTSHKRGQWTATLDGPRLRDLRRLHALTQQRLASQAGLAPATISRLEGQPEPNCRTRTMARLAIALGEHPAAFTRHVTFTPATK